MSLRLIIPDGGSIRTQHLNADDNYALTTLHSIFANK